MTRANLKRGLQELSIGAAERSEAMSAAIVDPTQPAAIGERLRSARRQKNMTIREIAQSIGVSPSLISQIERAKVNPSLSTLCSLVASLGLQMTDLFSAVAGGAGAQFGSLVDPRKPVTAPGRRAVISLASGSCWERLTSATDHLVEFLRITYPPGTASCDVMVHHPGREYGYVVRGRLGVQIACDQYELEPGMAISFDSSAPHGLWAIGNEPAEAIWVIIGRQSRTAHS